MPSLLINIVNNTGWTALISNTNIQYPFTVGSVADQEPYVQQLAAAMQDGESAVINGEPEIFLIPEGEEAAEVVQTMFGTTELLIYGGRPIYTAVGGDTLLDNIVEAGEVLMSFLP